jgi:hypothetical protein
MVGLEGCTNKCSSEFSIFQPKTGKKKKNPADKLFIQNRSQERDRAGFLVATNEHHSTEKKVRRCLISPLGCCPGSGSLPKEGAGR